MIVQKAFKYKFFPTDDQAEQLARTFGCSRYVYNQALDYRSKAWRQEKKSLGYHDTALKLTEWKKEPEKAFLSEVSSVVLQQSLRNLDTAFTNFFEKRTQYPKFKSRRHRQSVRYSTNAFTFRDGRIILAKQSEPLDIVWSRPLPYELHFLWISGRSVGFGIFTYPAKREVKQGSFLHILLNWRRLSILNGPKWR